MTPLAAVLFLVALSHATEGFESNTTYGYLLKYGVPAAERVRQLEQGSSSRIVGGSLAKAGQFPYQAGLLISFHGFNGSALCGASLLTANRLITAAHCWYDGQNQARLFEVILGSLTVFSGGTRIETSNVTTHPNWIPQLIRNDVAMIYLPRRVNFSSTIAPIALPSGSEIQNDFMGYIATASGYGLTANNGAISRNQSVSHVNVTVISNSLCNIYYPSVIRSTNVCTKGRSGSGTCRGDSGGPLVVTSNNRRILIGVTSFGSSYGCEIGFPNGFSRVTAFINFINRHL